MPALEMAQETGKLIAWRKKEGDRVTKGEPLLEIETDKAVVEVEAPADGILAGIKASAGDDIPVGQTIAWIVAPGEAVPGRMNRRRRPRAPDRTRRAESAHASASQASTTFTAAGIQRKNFSQGSPSRQRTRSRHRHGSRLRRRRRNPRLRCSSCCSAQQPAAPARQPSRQQIRQPRSAELPRPHHGRAHHAKLDHRPALLRHPRHRRHGAQRISRTRRSPRSKARIKSASRTPICWWRSSRACC